jgi:hypothetical protein
MSERAKLRPLTIGNPTVEKKSSSTAMYNSPDGSSRCTPLMDVKRQIKVGRFRQVESTKSARQDADDRRGRPRDRHRPTQRVRVGVEHAPPVVVRQHRYGRRTAPIFILGERSAACGADAERREEIMAREIDLAAPRHAPLLDDEHVLGSSGGGAVEDTARANGLDLGIRVTWYVAWCEGATVGNRRVDLEQPIRCFHRKRLQQHRREHRGLAHRPDSLQAVVEEILDAYGHAPAWIAGQILKAETAVEGAHVIVERVRQHREAADILRQGHTSLERVEQ